MVVLTIINECLDILSKVVNYARPLLQYRIPIFPA
jgi:hypothetical protein